VAADFDLRLGLFKYAACDYSNTVTPTSYGTIVKVASQKSNGND